jgi:hypothetical protein
MKTHLQTLASLGEAIGHSLSADVEIPILVREAGPLTGDLVDFLRLANGLYAFESALLVRPLMKMAAPLGIVEWNSPVLWRQEYEADLTNILFFAEDVFGGQFCIAGDKIQVFDPETGQLRELASSLEEWARLVLVEQFNYLTGYTLAHSWQTENRPLEPGYRLLPKVPFICEGKFANENLYMLEEVEGMRFRATIANQIRDIPDGSKVIFKLTPDARPEKGKGKGK